MKEVNKIRIERIFTAPIEIVWEAITERDQLKEWYFKFDEHFELVKGQEFEWTASSPDCVDWLHKGKMLEIIEPKKLMHTWEYPGYVGSSILTWELEAINESSTKLTLTHLFEIPFDTSVPALHQKEFEKGWNSIINISLEDYLNKI